ncbi:flavin reductase family protein [Mucilaginibacter achroorhodeus]|uniref:Flavin reductase family protein n=1 Tax=Mucilaginibacter achroorhodeus TaxID=2599294 RepID=A0A563U8W6_9SPHI|nr:flavin reductase family protein [Mucilaginibacter achroorhodeus]TWR27778.1 flavin reductase family protein [Mucilaginibacter achroorhodeus]
MLTLETKDLTPLQIQSYLNHAVAPRPICLASTVDKDGNVNLSPFSFFNLFSVNPPVCVFSASRRVRDNTTKHTLENIKEVPECVINIVSYDMVQQVSLSSVEYPAGVNEFTKAGLTEQPSQLVKPPCVAESPVQLECVIKDVIALGDGPGAGNLIIAEVKMIHIKEEILNEAGTTIDQTKTDLVARLGADWYCRVNAANLFEVAKPVRTIGIGVDNIPSSIRNSRVLTGNNLGQLGNVEALPDDEAIDEYTQRDEIKEIFDATIGDNRTRELQLHLHAKALLEDGRVAEAWMVLLAE